jgi:hypothetical protein
VNTAPSRPITVSEKMPDEAVCAPGPVGPDSARHLGPDMQRLLDECRPGRSVAEVIGSGWDDPDEARRMMYALQCLGLIALAPAAEQAQESEPGFSFDEFGQTEGRRPRPRRAVRGDDHRAG